MNNSVVLTSRRWQVLLLGGASGVGKSSISYRLARHFGAGLTEVDDFQVLLLKMTTPEQQPALHFWWTHPAPETLTAEEIMTQGLDIGRVMSIGLEAVIANHLVAGTSVVLEGDFIHPDLAARASFGDQPNGGRVRAVFLHEADEDQLVENYLRREPADEPQLLRARVSVLKSRWLKHEAERLGVPVVEARPWDTVFDRVLAAVA